MISSYPNFVCVNELPIDDSDEKVCSVYLTYYSYYFAINMMDILQVQIVKDLWEKGLVITDVPLDTL